jgi:hypothetical protein
MQTKIVSLLLCFNDAKVVRFFVKTSIIKKIVLIKTILF